MLQGKMVNRCAASKCTSRWKKESNISFHHFPVGNPELLKKWVTATKRKKFTPTKNTVLCSKHFTSDDFLESCEKKILKQDAIPSIFNTSLQKSWSKKRRTVNKSQALDCDTDSDSSDMPVNPSLLEPEISLEKEECNSGDEYNRDNMRVGVEDNVLDPLALVKVEVEPNQGQMKTGDAVSDLGTSLLVQDRNTKPSKDCTFKSFKCKKCDFAASKFDLLVIHRKIHTKHKHLACSHCDYRTARSADLNKHMRTHTGERPYMCSECDYKASCRGHLSEHIRTHTGQKPFSCSQCDYKASRRSQISVHMRTHTGEKPYGCSQCDFRAAFNSQVSAHVMKTHVGERPYVCTECDYKAFYSGDLTAHMRIHSGERPYLCTLCDYKASQNSHLLTHMKVHTGEKPYVCNQCDYRASRSSHLVAHKRIHSGEKPYVCGKCEYRAAQSSHLNVHMRTHIRD